MTVVTNAAGTVLSWNESFAPSRTRSKQADPRVDLGRRYALALHHYLGDPDEAALARAHELGRRALTEGFGVLDIATIHARAAGAALTTAVEPDRARVVDAQQAFFAEALAPFEMAHRGFWEANGVLRRLNDVLEGQARRIAAALHDDAVQLLASAHLALADAASKLPPDLAGDIQGTRALLDQIEERLRNLAHELRPPILEDLGLVPALEFLADSVARRWGFPVAVQASIPGDLPPIVETTVYRVAQEALTNVAKHAKATHAYVSVSQAALQLACSVRDDGVGLDPAALEGAPARGIGLLEIQERVAALGGALRICPNLPRGTDLTVEIPLER